VDWTEVLGPGRHAPRRAPAGGLLVPLDRAAIDLVWHPGGYPSRAAYRDSHRLTRRHHRPWANDGAPYDPARAAAQAQADARDFVQCVLALPGLCVCALDTELLGHHWHEGVDWLRAVLGVAEAAGLPVLPLDAALADARPEPAPADPPVTSWGEGRDLRTWSGELAWVQRAAELAALGAGPSARALRELLALQSSDWAFMIARDTAAAYGRERARGHREAFRAALAGDGAPALRNLAPRLAAWAFAQP